MKCSGTFIESFKYVLMKLSIQYEPVDEMLKMKKSTQYVIEKEKDKSLQSSCQIFYWLVFVLVYLLHSISFNWLFFFFFKITELPIHYSREYYFKTKNCTEMYQNDFLYQKINLRLLLKLWRMLEKLCKKHHLVEIKNTLKTYPQVSSTFIS